MVPNPSSDPLRASPAGGRPVVQLSGYRKMRVKYALEQTVMGDVA